MADDNKDILDGITSFVDSVAVRLEHEHHDLIEDPRLRFGADGAYAPRVQELLREVRQRSAEAGYYTMFVPEAAGGGGCGPSLLYETWRHLYSRYGPDRILPYATIAHWNSGPSVLCSKLTPTMREEVLPGLLDGTTTSCFGMSEPDAGSDAWAMRTTAKRDGDGWVLSGSKQWITNSPTAEWVFVWAVTDDAQRAERSGGVSCFLVPTTAPGFTVDSVIKMFGEVGGNEGVLGFDDVWVPDHALVGELHRGFSLAMAGVSNGRLLNSARSVGLARWALDLAARYALERKTFGSPIAEHQGVSFMLADSAVELYAADAMATDCAARMEAGERAHDRVAMSKLYCTEMCSRVYERCMQIHGAMGFTNELRLYAGWHTARMIRVADGSSEILRRTIARGVLDQVQR